MTEPSADLVQDDGGRSAGDSDPNEDQGMIPRVDLDKYKSATDQQIAAAQKQIAALQSELATRNKTDHEQKLAAIEDPKDRRVAELEFEMQQLQQQFQAVDVNTQKGKALKRISEEAGVPIEILNSANDEAAAWKLAFQHKQANTPAATPTKPVLGNTPTPKKRDFAQEIVEAKSVGDFAKVMELTAELRAEIAKG